MEIFLKNIVVRYIYQRDKRLIFFLICICVEDFILHDLLCVILNKIVISVETRLKSNNY